MSQTSNAIADLSRYLHAQGRLQVWSVIITILGEIAQPEGGEISMAALLELCVALDIEPQAVRTAMSRLSKDGLVVGTREGRTANYQFSSQALAEYHVAANVIYAAPKLVEDWTFVFAADVMDMTVVQKIFASNPPLVLGGRCFVWPADTAPQPSDITKYDLMLFEAQPRSLPHWAQSSVLPTLNPETCQKISSGCQDLQDRHMDPDQARIARVLLIHFWRRLVLRYPTVEAPIAYWPLAQVHRDIAVLYPQLLRLSGVTNVDQTRFR
jgi:phenylacetic acid degradation operon negative regulatory protein